MAGRRNPRSPRRKDRVARSRERSFRRAVSFGALLFLLASLLPSLSCSHGSQKPDVILVVVDTLRPDFVRCYNPLAGPTTTIDSLASRGVLFSTCIAQAPWTLPSIATILSGRYPGTHGADRLGRKISPKVPLLAEALGEMGYSTGAVVSGVLAGRKYGFDRGFDYFDESSAKGRRHVSSEAVTDSAIHWLAQTTSPFFLFVHYFDPHYSYMHHDGFTIHAGSYEGDLRPGMDIWDLREIRAELDAGDMQYLRELYAGEVLHTDHHLGRLLSFVDRRFRGRGNIVVLTGDHGEEFMEHGWLGHTRTVYQEAIRVPLVITHAGRLEPGVVATPVSHVDLFPTILDLLGRSPGELPGRGLFRAPLRERPQFSESVFRPQAPANAGNRRRKQMEKQCDVRSVQFESWKAIEDRLADTVQLFHLETDPGEKEDSGGRNPGTLKRLMERLHEWKETMVVDNPDTTEITQEEYSRLRELGYIR